MCGPESCGRSRGRRADCASEAERRRPEAQRPRRRLPPPGPPPRTPGAAGTLRRWRRGGPGAAEGRGGRVRRGLARGAARPGKLRRASPGAGKQAPVLEAPSDPGRRQLSPGSFSFSASLPPAPALSHLTKQRSRKVKERSQRCRSLSPRGPPRLFGATLGKKRISALKIKVWLWGLAFFSPSPPL